MIQATSKIEIPLIANKVAMPMLCKGEEAYIPLSFLYDLGASEKELKSIIEKEKTSLKENSLKVYFEGKTYSAIPRSLGVKIVSELPKISDKPIFKKIHRQLLKLSLDSEVVIDHFAEDYRNDHEFWSQKLIAILRQPRREIMIPAHPAAGISEDGENYNHEALGYIMVDQIANSHRVEDRGRNARTKLQEMLEFHRRDKEYNFFLYNILTGDINTCLLAQTMFADWIDNLCEQQQI